MTLDVSANDGRPTAPSPSFTAAPSTTWSCSAPPPGHTMRTAGIGQRRCLPDLRVGLADPGHPHRIDRVQPVGSRARSCRPGPGCRSSPRSPPTCCSTAHWCSTPRRWSSIVPIGDEPADVVVDGWLAATLDPGQVLHCGQGQRDARLVTFGERNFHRILKSKFNLADR